jgi:hypothetical protein
MVLLAHNVAFLHTAFSLFYPTPNCTLDSLMKFGKARITRKYLAIFYKIGSLVMACGRYSNAISISKQGTLFCPIDEFSAYVTYDVNLQPLQGSIFNSTNLNLTLSQAVRIRLASPPVVTNITLIRISNV